MRAKLERHACCARLLRWTVVWVASAVGHGPEAGERQVVVVTTHAQWPSGGGAHHVQHVQHVQAVLGDPPAVGTFRFCPSAGDGAEPLPVAFPVPVPCPPVPPSHTPPPNAVSWPPHRARDATDASVPQAARADCYHIVDCAAPALIGPPEPMPLFRCFRQWLLISRLRHSAT